MSTWGVFFGSKLHVEALQSVVPTNPTDPRKSSRVHLHQHASFTTVIQRCFHVLLCYNTADEEDSGWRAAGWIKESLGTALQEQPLLAGRLRRDCSDLEIVSNDSGVRLVEARADVKLDEFLELKEKGEAVAELLFWEDVADNNPQFSPLLYVQVTNFNCGGYSIGISCSLLLADPFVLTGFIKRWADLHNNMVPKTDVPKLPTFYLPSIGKTEASRALHVGSKLSKRSAQSVTFKTPTRIANLGIVAKNLAALCIDKAECEVGAKMASEFSLFVQGPSKDDAEIEICSRQGVLEHLASDNTDGLNCERTLWNNELGLDSVSFNGGKKPAYSTSWINSVIDQGSVMILPSEDETKIIVTFT